MHKVTTVALSIAFALLFAVAFTFSPFAAHGATHHQRVRYIARPGSPTNIDRVVIKAACIGAEDSAGHLKLVSYGNGRAVYACAKHGY